MKKIIAAFDGLNFSESTLEYALELAKHNQAHLTGVFLREFTQVGYELYASMVEDSPSGKTIMDKIENADQTSMKDAIAVFEAGCQMGKINYSVHQDKGSALNELLHESIFADLVIVDAHETFSYLENKMPGWFLKNVLHSINCPVLVVPKKFNPVKKLLLLYDGSPSSVYAIKMFNYIFPEMRNLDAVLFNGRDNNDSLHLPDNKLIKEWIKKHYSRIEYKMMRASEKEIPLLIKEEGPEIMVITGSYHRSNLSMLFHKSIADSIIQETRVPVFIAHR